MLSALVLCLALVAEAPVPAAADAPPPPGASSPVKRVGPGWRAGVAVAALGASAWAFSAACFAAGVAIAWTDVVPANRPGSYSFTANFARTGLSQNLIFLGMLTAVLGLAQVSLGGLAVVADLP